MPKKTVAIFTAVVFGLFSTGCISMARKEIRTSADYPAPNTRVLSVVKKSGETVTFSPGQPPRIVGDRIVGTVTTLRERDVEIEGPFPLIRRLADGTVTEVTDARGKVWPVHRVLKEEPNRMTVRFVESVSGTVDIPLSEVLQIKYKRRDRLLTFMALTAGVAGALAIGFFVMMAISLDDD